MGFPRVSEILSQQTQCNRRLKKDSAIGFLIDDTNQDYLMTEADVKEASDSAICSLALD